MTGKHGGESDAIDMRKLWRVPLHALGLRPRDASELAAVLSETSPDICIDSDVDRPMLRSTLSARRVPSALPHAPS